jgi:dihydroorotate dehydrogenase electron transfer subunit
MRNITAAVMENLPVAEGINQMVLSLPRDVFEEYRCPPESLGGDCAKGFAPGMFVHLALSNSPDKLLRRPIGIMDADECASTLTLAIQKKGEGTCSLCAAAPGDPIDMLAPIGRGFSLGTAAEVWLVGGGVGAAPMMFAAKSFSGLCRLRAFLGFKSADCVFGFSQMANLCPTALSTDDASAGFMGSAVDLIVESIGRTGVPDLIMACGPTPMLKAVASLCREHKIKGQLSMEQRMGCGYGACLTCACKVVDDGAISFERVCVDGPVFDAERVVF